MTMLSPLLQQIQIGLFVVSGLLGLGAVYGLVVGAEGVSEGINPLVSNSGKASPIEQRRFSRTPCNMPLEVIDGAERIAATGRLLNISASGACFVSDTVYLKDDIIVARLPAMRQGANKISGRIVWSRSKRGNTFYGLRLNSTTPA